MSKKANKKSVNNKGMDFSVLGYDKPPSSQPPSDITSVSSIDGIQVDRSKLALVMMVKNEEKRIEVSFDSVRPLADTFVILDTGSTDSTIQICRDYCKRHNITLHLKEETFVNFKVSRNVMLDFCDEAIDKKNPKYLLLLDCNDELKSHRELAQFISTHSSPANGFYLKQNWWTGNNLDSYFNIRMVKSHCGWRYDGVVHEYIHQKGVDQKEQKVIRLENIILFQDRTKDDDKSFKRFNRDKELLYTEYLKDNTEPRTLFYLGQTCGCLGNAQEAYKYYLLRIRYKGFIEEVYQSYFRLGETAQQLGHPWEESLNWYLKAFSHSTRAEPLVRLAEYYKDAKRDDGKPDILTSYMYANMACQLAYPFNQILFVDRRCYIYKRWHLLGAIAFRAQRYREGKAAAIRAYMIEGQQVDLDNVVAYLRKDAEIIQQQKIGNGVPQIELSVMSTDNGDILSADEVQQMQPKFTKEEVLRKAYELITRKK